MNVDVVFFMAHAKEMSYPLDLAAELSTLDDISVDVYSLFEPHETSHSLAIESFDAESRTDVSWWVQLYRTLQREDPDVVHIHPAVSGSIARVVASCVRGVKVVSTEHGSHDQRSPIKSLVAGSTIGFNDVVVTNSEETRKSIKRWEEFLLSICRTRTEVIHNGIDIAALDEASSVQPPIELQRSGTHRIGAIGRLVPVKNFQSLLKATSILDRKGIDVELVVVGDGPLRSDLEARAEALGIDGITTFTGELSRESVYSVFHTLDVYAFPSIHEGFGNVGVEAMAAGVPVVANDIPALREVLGDTGVFVDAEDPRALADGLRKLIANPSEREELVGIARRRAVERFSLRSAAESHSDLYRSLTRHDE